MPTHTATRTSVVNRATRRRIGAGLVYGTLAVLAAASVLPFLWMVATSFKFGPDVYTRFPQPLPLDHRTGAWHPTLGNYRYVLGVGGLGQAFVNSVVICLILVPAKLLVDAFAGYAFARLQFPGRDKLFLLLLSGMMVPGIALLVPRVHVTQQLGLFNTGWGVIVPNLASVLDIFLLRQFFRTLPRELEEAALLDGAGRMQIFWRVVLPLSKPVIAVVTITSFIFHWNDLLWPLVVLNDKGLYTLPVALQQLATQESGRAYYIMAGATLAVVPVLVVLVFFQRRILDGIAFTGLKG